MALKVKFTLALLLICALLSIPAFIGYKSNQRTQDLLDAFVNINIEEIDHSSLAIIQLKTLNTSLLSLLIHDHHTPIDFTSGGQIEEQIKQLNQTSLTLQKAVKEDFDQADQNEMDTQTREREIEELEETLETAEAIQNYINQANLFVQQSQTHNSIHRLTEIYEKVVQFAYQDAFEKLTDLHEDAVKEAKDEALHFNNKLAYNNQLVFITAGGAFVVSILLASFLASRLLKPLQTLTKTANQITPTNLDLRVDIDTSDEIQELADNFNRMLDDLQRSIEEREIAKDELRALARSLEEQIRERTHSLEIAKRTAEEASEAKSVFLSAMSHELRTPLNAILGFAQVMEVSKRNPLNDKQKASIRQIIHAGEYLLELVTQILELSSIEAGRIQLDSTNTVVTAPIEDAIQFLEHRAKQKNVTILNTVPSLNLPQVFVDSTRLKQVLVNLLNNAIKYNEQNGEVVIEADKEDDRVVVKIHDTGIGIPDDVASKLFTPFERLGRENSNIEGVGIGLSLSQKIIHSMNGEIGYQSSPNGGATFWVSVPIAKAPADMVDTDNSTDNKNKAIKQGRKQILYIEDAPENIAVIASFVEEFDDITLHACLNAPDGIKFAQKHQPHLILMDISLPGMDGIEATRILSEDETTKHIPIIALSAGAMKHNLESASQVPFKQYLTKPVNLGSLHKVFETYLQS